MLKLATLCYVKQRGLAGGQTLMLHRIKKANDMHAGKWNGLGGKLEAGETPEACARREILEESGLAVGVLTLHGVLTFPAFRPGEDWYTFVFTASGCTGALIDSPEGRLAWIDDDKLLDLPLWAGDRIFIPWLAQERFFSGQFVYVAGELVEHSVVFYPPLPVFKPGLAEPSLAVAMPELAAAGETAPSPVPGAEALPEPVYTPKDDTYCWVCGGPVIKRHCKIVCQACGFTRDCSDP